MRSHFYSGNANLQTLPEQLNLCVGMGVPSPPSEGFGFRAPPVADAARRQAAAVRKCKANAAARAVGGEGAKVARRIKD